MGRCDPSTVETPKMHTLQTTRTLVLFRGISFWDTAFTDDRSDFFLFEWLVYCSQGIVRSSRSNGTITRLPKPTRNNTTIILTACTTTVHLGFITRTNLVLQRFAFDFRDFARFLRWLQVFSVWDWNKLLNSSDFKRTKCVNHRRQKKWSHVNLDVLLSVKRLWELRWNCKLQSMRDCATHHRSLS